MQQLYPQCIDIFRDNPKMVRTPSKGVMSGNVWKGGEIHFVNFFHPLTGHCEQWTAPPDKSLICVVPVNPEELG